MRFFPFYRMRRSSRTPKSVRPRTVRPDLGKAIRQTMPRLERTIRNLRNYGVNEDEINQVVEDVYDEE